jgi:hypothetical protein
MQWICTLASAKPKQALPKSKRVEKYLLPAEDIDASYFQS